MEFMLTNEMKHYARYLLKSNKRLCAILWITLFVVIPFLMIVMETGIDIIIFFTEFCGYSLACLTPIFLFRFMYRKRCSDLYFSLPIKRRQFFFVTYITGFITILIPVLINLIISTGFSLMFRNEFTNRYYVSNFIFVCAAMFILYAIITWIVQYCNNLLDGICVSVGYIIIPLLFIGAMAVFFNNQYSGFMIGGGSYWSEIPGYNLIPNMVSILWLIVSSSIFGYPEVFNMNWVMMTYWMIVAIICIWFACKSFEQRRQEDSEQRTSAWWTYPLIIGVLTFCLILMIVNANMSSLTILVTSISVFVLYICMISFSRRKIQLTLRSFLLFGILFISTFSFSFIFKETRGFNLVKELPKVSAIANVNINIYYRDYDDNGIPKNLKVKYKEKDGKEKTVKINNLNALTYNEKEIENIVRMQEVYMKEKDDKVRAYNGTYVTLRYTLKNGLVINRDYYINNETAIEDIESILTSNAQENVFYTIDYKQFG